MDVKSYGPIRWKICSSFNSDEIEKNAVKILYGVVRHYLPYVLTVCEAKEITENDNIIYVGTLKSNDLLTHLANDFYTPETKSEGYSLKVAPSVRAKDRTDIVIQGADSKGVLNGVYDFIHYYIDDLLKYTGYIWKNRHQPFIDECLEFERRSAPSILNRGLWTWGHVIYDYKRYIENMAACKMNMLIMWNDFAPINGREIVDYAHSYGIKVIWGYPCAWGYDVDPTNDKEMEKWCDRVLEVYNVEYSHLGGDGVYFQGFTETNQKEINGKPIAELISVWVNNVADKLHSRYPQLYVQFGIHATSIGKNYALMSKINQDVTVVWEDAGGFPYNYDPRKGMSVERTLEYTDGLLSAVSGNGGRFGAVLKGFTCLNWSQFEHYKGRCIVGESDPIFMKKRGLEKEFFWDFSQPYWINNAGALKKYVQTLVSYKLVDSTVTALVEDAMFEEYIRKEIGIYSELLWDSDADVNKILEMVCHSEHYAN